VKKQSIVKILPKIKQVTAEIKESIKYRNKNIGLKIPVGLNPQYFSKSLSK
jgi:hypothetical protein